jgi:hypothetical protein
MHNHAHEIEENGFTIIPHALDQNQLQSIRVLVDEIIGYAEKGLSCRLPGYGQGLRSSRHPNHIKWRQT